MANNPTLRKKHPLVYLGCGCFIFPLVGLLLILITWFVSIHIAEKNIFLKTDNITLVKTSELIPFHSDERTAVFVNYRRFDNNDTRKFIFLGNEIILKESDDFLVLVESLFVFGPRLAPTSRFHDRSSFSFFCIHKDTKDGKPYVVKTEFLGAIETNQYGAWGWKDCSPEKRITISPKTIKRDFAPPHVMYLASWMGYSGSITLNFSGNGGVGVTFGEPITIPEGTFDTGIEKYLPKQEPPKYEPKDVTGIGTAVDPTWTNTIWAVLEGGLLGADAGAGEVFYKFSLPFAWISGQENSEFAWLRQGRDAAWVASGLDGTGTQYWTQCSANVAVSAFYSAAALEGAAYVGITEVGHATSVRCAYTTVLVQDC